MLRVSLFTSFFYLLLFISCTKNSTLRFYLDIRSAYDQWDLSDVDRLFEVSLQNNRDLTAASVYYLGLCLRDLSLGKGTTKRNLKLNTKEKKTFILKIKNHLKRLYSINNDFNIRNLCVVSIAYHQDQETIDFLNKNLSSHLEESTIEVALKSLRDFILDKKHDTSKTILSTLKLISKENNALFHQALYNLTLYPPNEQIDNGLANYLKINEGTYRSLFVKKAMDNRKKDLQ